VRPDTPFAVGIYHPKSEVNVGTLWRTAHAFGASFVFTVGRRYREQASDTSKATRWLPLFHYADMADLIAHLPHGWPLVGVECPGHESVATFRHPRRACYLLGAEDHGLSREALAACHAVVNIPGATHCLNVAVAGSIVVYERLAQLRRAA